MRNKCSACGRKGRDLLLIYNATFYKNNKEVKTNSRFATGLCEPCATRVMKVYFRK